MNLMKIAALISCAVMLGLFIFATQTPVTLTEDEVAKAVTEATAELESPIDEDVLVAAVQRSVAKLEHAQRTRLKYLAAAYFVIWLIFILYVIYLERQQRDLDKRLTQLEQNTVDP